VPDRAEQGRLRSGFGTVLRLERGHWTQQRLGDAAGLDKDREANVRSPDITEKNGELESCCG